MKQNPLNTMPNNESEPDAPTQDGCGKPPAGPDKP